MFMTRGSTVGQRSTPGWNQWSGLSQQMGKGIGGMPALGRPSFPSFQQGSRQTLGAAPGFQPAQQGRQAIGFPQQPQSQAPAVQQGTAPAFPQQQGQPTFQSQIQGGDLYSPQATSQGMANIMAMAQQQAASANRYTLPGFSRASPGLQAAANRDAAKSLMSGIANAQNLGLSDRLANAENQLGAQRARFGDVFAQLENALAMQQQQGLWNAGNREMALNAAMSQQASDTNWLNMALQGQQQGWGNQLNWLGNLYSMGMNEANLGQQQNNAVLSALLGLI